MSLKKLHLNWRCQSGETLQPSVSFQGQLHVLEIRKKSHFIVGNMILVKKKWFRAHYTEWAIPKFWQRSHRSPHELTGSSPDLPVFLVTRVTFTYSFLMPRPHLLLCGRESLTNYQEKYLLGIRIFIITRAPVAAYVLKRHWLIWLLQAFLSNCFLVDPVLPLRKLWQQQ